MIKPIRQIPAGQTAPAPRNDTLTCDAAAHYPSRALMDPHAGLMPAGGRIITKLTVAILRVLIYMPFIFLALSSDLHFKNSRSACRSLMLPPASTTVYQKNSKSVNIKSHKKSDEVL
jgi:hypothetical protein